VREIMANAGEERFGKMVDAMSQETLDKVMGRRPADERTDFLR